MKKQDFPSGRGDVLVATSNELPFSSPGYTNYGDWYAEAVVSPVAWQPGSALAVSTKLRVTEAHLAALGLAGFKADGFCLLLTAERTFDADGRIRLTSDERMSTLLTPTGIAIEGGIQGAATNRFGYGFRTPVDEYVTKTLAQAQKLPSGEYETAFVVSTALPASLPPGIYRIRLDYGITVKTNRFNLNGEAFARRPFFKGTPTESHVYSPPIPASGTHISGRSVDASQIVPRLPWVLLGDYNSNGCKGVVADEDTPYFGLSSRNLIQDELVLARYAADNKTVISYSLEPQLPTDTIELRSNIPWDFAKGELSVQVSDPDGKTTNLGTAPFAGNRGQWPTTKNAAFTAWKPSKYGYYTVKATGWLADIWGRRYEGGGTYHFWIAKRMTLATATFQGFAFPVGARYGRDLGFAPAVPADVEVTATLYVNSNVNDTRSITFKGKASPAGIYGTAQGAQQLPLDAPGEYHARILARYTDQDGHLWICPMRHAGVVYAADTPIIARGKKLTIKDKMVDRGETQFEGWVESADISHLAHINYPFQSGDVLLIASDQKGANKIEPVLTWELKTNPAPYDSRVQGIGLTNLQLKTSNGYSPHLFPEYITDWAYYYAGAPRPGFMSRFLVAEDGTRAPYWPVSPNAFGGQINASSNGDVPGDIYRLIGGVVLRKKDEAPAYAGYLSSAFLLPRWTCNNRVIAAGSEDLMGPDWKRGRLFLVGTRPGMVYETGTVFAAAMQIDPVLPATVKVMLTYPDGRQVTTEGTGDSFGSCVGKDRWTLDMPGVYRIWLEADWQGYKGYMPGLPKDGGMIFVMEKERPAGASSLKLNLPEQSAFSAGGWFNISGTSTAKEVYYAAVIPGCVVDQGTLPVMWGKFEYFFNPQAIHSRVATYDTASVTTGRPEIMEVVHLTFFSKEITSAGNSYHSFLRLIIRGTSVIYAY
jgi:hypothetical protein